MEWTTHALTGMVLGYAVTNNWKMAVISGLTAIIPDLDEPKSRFGKSFFFISIPLNQLFGHRTFTHSLLFVAITGLITLLFGPKVSIASMIGILAHIFGDMLTGRVQLFYPKKMKVGLKISRMAFLITDRFTRLMALLWLGVIVYQDVLRNI
ncbi:metal-dependent hydrolase [Bacillus sp. DFI.2.34]|uniref:metal-dependent hydrolase n=1 Tax=Caldibacillus thermoamylovorans TaxID=35841 RepID=UPI001D06D068|nr:metal-dependent hydrolase [Caldibacillus thermoamylovorans]MCB5935617.1 metal-dependent hydrolase [Bacillus sp. DFI.2.34]